MVRCNAAHDIHSLGCSEPDTSRWAGSWRVQCFSSWDLALQMREPLRSICIFLAYFISLIFPASSGHCINSEVMQRIHFAEAWQCTFPTNRLWNKICCRQTGSTSRDSRFHEIQLSNPALWLDFKFSILQWLGEVGRRAVNVVLLTVVLW